jgi:aspartate kinase
METLIVKFGGSCLSTPSNITAAAQKIAAEVRKGKKIIIVVSALTGVTDNLLKLANDLGSKNVAPMDLDDILSMGERTSARLMATALRTLGVKAVTIDPSSDIWPIHTDATYGNAKVNLVNTEQTVVEKLKPLLEDGTVVVVPGFIGLSPEGKITTLGRGGSDVTAVILGRFIGAKEVVFVKDVNGVLSGDPKIVASAETIDSLDAEEMFSLSSAGAKVLHPQSLRYKTDSLTLRVVGFNDADLSHGTIINGIVNLELKATIHDQPLSMVTIVGHEVSSPETLANIVAEAASSKSEILGLTVAHSSILFYLQQSEDFIQRLHNLIRSRKVAKAIHSFNPLSMILISGQELEKMPGIVDVVVAPLAKHGINLYGVMTISSSIRVFVPWKDREKALDLIEKNLNNIKVKEVI